MDKKRDFYAEILKAIKADKTVVVYAKSKSNYEGDRVRIVKKYSCEFSFCEDDFRFGTSCFTRGNNLFNTPPARTPNSIVERMKEYDQDWGITVVNIDVWDN